MSHAVIDARAVPPLERHTLIFSAFDELPPGAAFELINNHDPVPLFFQFRQARKGQFEWHYLTEGPATWRVRISKSAPSHPPA
jgi:uncharacterized protein (DUF2249 family)